jgi:nucleoside-diphosphate-sugar epimerase
VKVFVTGGTGFVGTHLVAALCARGAAVTCLVRTPDAAAALARRGVQTVRGDLDDAAALRAGCAGAEVIIHAAGCIRARHPDEFLRVNRDGTAHLLAAAAARPPARFVFVSSLAAAGPSRPGAPVDERRPPAPVSAYGRSKLAAEQLVQAAPFPWTVVRPPTVYGEWDRELLKIFKLARLGVVPVFGDGAQELSVIYAGDLAAALVAAATAPAAANRLYYAAHPATITSRELVHAVGRAVGRVPRIVPLPAPLARALLRVAGSAAQLAGRATVLSPDKAPEFLAPAWTCRPDALIGDTGWRPATELDAGLRRTAAWYRTEGWL